MKMQTKFVAAILLFTPATGTLAQEMQMPAQHTEHQHHGEIHPVQAEFPRLGRSQEKSAGALMTLDQFEKIAGESNPTLRQAEAEIRAANARRQQAGLYPNPSVGYQGEQIRGGSYGGGEQGGFVQQTVVLGGKLGLRRGIYEQQTRSDQIGVEEQTYRVHGDVQQAFYDALTAQATVQLRQRLLGVSLDAVETVHQLANVGQADAPDILQTEVETEQAKVDYGAAQRVYLKNFAKLMAMVGMPEMQVTRVEGDLYAAPQVDVTAVVARITSTSPMVRRVDQQIAVAQASVVSAKRQVVPDLTLRAGEQYNGELVSDNPRRATGAQSFASASIGLPLWNRNQGNVQAATADAVRAKEDARRVRLELAGSAQAEVEEYLTAQMQVERYKTELLPRAQRAYELYRTKYDGMAVAYPLVLVSQRTYFQLRVGYIEALRTMWSSAVSLNNSLLSGGLDAPQGGDVVRSGISTAE